MNSNLTPKGIDDAIVSEAEICTAPAEDLFGTYPWEDPIPLSDLFEVPTFKSEFIPAKWLPWMEDVSKRIGVPTEMVFINALSAFSTISGRSFIVQPKANDTGWKAYLSNLWCMVIAPSGSKKSPAMSVAFEPLSEFERELVRSWNEQKKKNKPELDLLRLQKKALEKLAKEPDGATPQVKAQLMDLNEKIEELNVQLARLLTQEATIQALCVLLQTNHLGIGLTFDELSGFFRGLDREGRQTDRAFFLSAWNGNDAYNGDTVSRGHKRVEHLAITINGSIQPKILANYLENLVEKNQHGDGLLARFQLLAMPEPKHVVGEDKAPDDIAEFAYKKSFRIVGRLRSQKKACEFSPYVYKFDQESQQLFNAFLEDLERQVADSTHLDLYHEFLAKQRSTMPLLAMLFQVIDLASDHGKDEAIQFQLETDCKIGLSCTQRAAEFCEWLRATARALYCEQGDPILICAHKILKKSFETSLDGMTSSVLIRKGWAGITDQETVQKAINLLKENKILVENDFKTGGRPFKAFSMNPKRFDLQKEVEHV